LCGPGYNGFRLHDDDSLSWIATCIFSKYDNPKKGSFANPDFCLACTFHAIPCDNPMQMILYRSTYLALPVMLLIMSFASWVGCTHKHKIGGNQEVFFTSLRDIPEITAEEINAIDELRKKYRSFSYGMLLSTETFRDENDKIRGFTGLFCEWLTELFEIPFIPQIHDWDDLVPTLKTDFTGELTSTEERKTKLGYFFSDAITERSVMYFYIPGSSSRREILKTRPLRLAFLEESTTALAVIDKLKEASVPYEAFYFNDYATAYDMIAGNKVDAVVDENISETAFEEFGDVATENFFPLIYEPVSLATQNPELEPIIRVVQKALNNGGRYHLVDLYDRGNKEYARHKLLAQLSTQEQAYLQENKAVQYLAEYDNYPLSFYNHNEKRWQGIAFDVLSEITSLTGLTFEPIHKPDVSFADLMKMLENGEGAMLSELIRTDQRKGRFIWPENDLLQDNYVAISLEETPNISIHRIALLKVGVQKGTAYAELFSAWFPAHKNIIEYDSTESAFKGLEDGEIDILMYSVRNLLTATNYNERPGFKANIVFEYTFRSTFGLNKDEEILCSIVDKAMSRIDGDAVAARWLRKTYDYRSKIVQSQRPWLIGTIGLFFVVIVLTFTMYLRSRNVGRRLDMLVQSRTVELNISRQHLSLALHDAEAANRAKSAFLATMSHEIRTPMNAIIGITQIELQKSDLPNEYVTALNHIYSSGNSLLGIINDILDLSKIESGKMELHSIEYDMPNFINDTVLLNIVRIGTKQIEFILDVSENLPSRFVGDELRLKQILNNILSNSIKYTERGHVKLSVDHLAEDTSVTLRFMIEDSGQGMKPEDLTKLFSEFARFNANANQTTEGTGLGLMITKKLVEMMDGTIHVESTYGKGSRFTVEIRQKGVDCDAIGPEISARLRNFTFSNKRHEDSLQVVHAPMPYGKVLVVDDVRINLLVAEGLMMLYKLHVETVNSGLQAIDLVKSGKTYDVVFMDHMMPQMDGIETTQHLRALGYAGTIVALTANALVGNEEMFLHNGFDDFISKPIDTLHLDSILNKYIRDKHSCSV